MRKSIIALAVAAAIAAPLIKNAAMNPDARFMQPKLRALNQEKDSWKGRGKRKMGVVK